MGELIAFRLPKTATRPRARTRPGIILFFTGVRREFIGPEMIIAAELAMRPPLAPGEDAGKPKTANPSRKGRGGAHARATNLADPD
jgi:hypothetical protein